MKVQFFGPANCDVAPGIVEMIVPPLGGERERQRQALLEKLSLPSAFP